MSIRKQSKPGRLATFGIVLVALAAAIVFVSQQSDTAESAIGGGTNQVDIMAGRVDVDESGPVIADDLADVVLDLVDGSTHRVDIIDGKVDVNQDDSIDTGGISDELTDVVLEFLDPSGAIDTKTVNIIDGRVDVNQDDTITSGTTNQDPDDLAAVSLPLLGGGDPVRVNIRDGEVDVNADGEISAVGTTDNLANVLLPLAAGGTNEVDIIDGQVDVNQDGSIDIVGNLDDLAGVLLTLAAGGAPDEVDIIAGEVDVDQDGSIVDTGEDDLTDVVLDLVDGAAMSMSVDTAGTVTCDNKPEDRVCVALNAEFDVIVSADAIPFTNGYIGYSAFLQYGDTGLTVNLTGIPPIPPVATSLWPDAESATFLCDDDGTGVSCGALTGLGLFEPPPPSFHKGDLVSFSFTCASDDSSHKITLETLDSPNAGTSGASYAAWVPPLPTPPLDPSNIAATTGPDLLINCGAGAAEDTPTPGGPTLTPTPSPTPSPTACPEGKVPANGACGTPTLTPTSTPILPVISLGAEGLACDGAVGAGTPIPTPFIKPEGCTADFFPGQEKEGAFIVTINANLLPTPVGCPTPAHGNLYGCYGGLPSAVVLLAAPAC